MGRRKNYPWNSRTDKQMTNLVSGLLTGLIVAPFAAVDALSKCNVSTTNHYAQIRNNSRKNISKHQSLIQYLSEKTDRSIKSDYNKIIESNEKIKSKLELIEFKIALHKDKLTLFGFIKSYKEKWSRAIKDLKEEESLLEGTYKSPIICLDKYSSSYTRKIIINGHVLLLVNRVVKNGSFLEENAICRRIDTNKSFFRVSKEPNIKFSFNSIEIFFYDHMMLIMTENDFVIVENDAYSLDYRIVHFEAVGVHIPRSSTHWYNVGIIDIKTYSQTISLLFFKKEEGDRFYRLIEKYRKTV